MGILLLCTAPGCGGGPRGCGGGGGIE